MLQLLQHLGNGRTILMEVPAPGPRAGALLIRTTRSLISAGTERMLVDFGKAGWIGKARQQPEKVRAVLNKARANGLLDTMRAVRAKLQQPIPLGYCQVGVVVDAGDQLGARSNNLVAVSSEPGAIGEGFKVGDRVVSNGPHAEVVSVQHDLCAKVPAGVSDEAATFAPLCAIALQGINLLAVAPGDKVVVAGLGLIGQLAVRILGACGCEVLGLDPSPERRALAEKSGVKTAEGDPVTAALGWTNGQGVAGVLITASTSSNEVVNQAARSCRPRGKVVLVGVVGLQLNRADFYRNEISFQVSCSYGARDARAASSAQGNFNQVLAWMAAGKLPVEDLITHRFDFIAASTAYAALADRTALGVVMTYGGQSATLNRAVELRAQSEEPRAKSPEQGARPRIAVIGAGNFAMRTLLPAMTQLSAPPMIAAVASAQGASALLAAQTFGAERATTDVASLLTDPSVKAVFITTRHAGHASQALAAMKAGKHVWVEKPLCLNLEELHSIEKALSSQLSAPSSAPPVLMVGFNRRFAPMAVALRKALAQRSGAHRITITVNAGRLDPDHWTLDPRAGGGRIVGEGCHFVDLVRFLAGSPIMEVRCRRRDTDGQDGGEFEVIFSNGAVAAIDYRTDLPPHMPKEIIAVSGEGFSAQIHNWSKLTSSGLGGLSGGSFWSRAPRKGHPEALAAFLQSVGGGAAPIAADEIFEVSRWSIAMQAMRTPTG